MGPWPPLPPELRRGAAAWAGGAPCHAVPQLIYRLTLATNLAFARRHGHALFVARFDAKAATAGRHRGRHPTWFKLVVVLGLLEHRERYGWIVSLDLDASLTSTVALDAWLYATLGGGPPPCMVAGLDGEQEGVVNTGVLFFRNDVDARSLLSRWWAWPLEGEDGAASWRHRWDYGFYHEQSVLNVGILPDPTAGGCVHVRAAGDFYVAPGTVARHFTGMCPLAPPFDGEPEPEKSSSARRCRCWLSHFGATRAAARMRA